TEGHPSIDVSEMNVRRFGKHFADLHYTVERAREIYKYYYYLHYPNDEAEWGRPLRLSPLYPRLQELGAVFGEKNGWERANYFEPGKSWRQAGADQRGWGWGHPPYFEQVGAEHRAVRERVGLLDMSSFGKLDVQGPDALGLLQRLSNNNVDKPVGSLTYSQFLNKWGGIESDVTIARLGEERFRVITGSAFAANDLGWITMHLPKDGSVTVTDVTDDWAVISLWGPRARDVLTAVTANDVSNAAFPYMTAQAINIGDVNVWAQRVSYAGELGWEMYVAAESAVQVWDTLMVAGQKYNIQSVGYKALESLRLEKGYRYWSADITPDENPYEAGLGFAVKLKSGGDFIGREALLKVKEQGIRRRLCTLAMADTSCVIYGGEAVYAHGDLVGRVRSGGYGYTVGKNIALSYLPVALAKAGTQVAIEIFSETIPAEVAADALYDSRGERLKA
ncbi:MAG: glycine cleavage T C-terminal barrel domain-containing protein, partial [Anaerolineae bacterium]